MSYYCINSPQSQYISGDSGWYRGWYQTSNGSLLPFAYSLPSGYNPETQYPVLMGMGGSYAGAHDTIGAHPGSGTFGDFTIEDMGNSQYRIYHSYFESFTLNKHIGLMHPDTHDVYLFRIIEIGEGFVLTQYDSPELLPNPLPEFISAAYYRYHYMFSQAGSLQRNSEIIENHGPVIGLAFGTAIFPRGEDISGLPGDYPRLADSINEFMFDLLDDGKVSYYTRIGDGDPGDATLTLYKQDVLSTYNPIDGFDEESHFMSIDTNRIYAFGMSFGALHFSGYARYYPYLAGVLAIDGASMTEPLFADRATAIYERNFQQTIESPFGYEGVLQWDSENNKPANDVVTLTSYPYRRIERFELWQRIKAVAYPTPVIVSVQSNVAYGTKEFVEMTKSFGNSKLFIFAPVKSPIDGSYSFDSHISDNQIRRATGRAVSGYVYVADIVDRGRIIEFHPQLTDEKTGATPMDILYSYTLQDRRADVEPDFPMKITLGKEDNFYGLVDVGTVIFSGVKIIENFESNCLISDGNPPFIDLYNQQKYSWVDSIGRSMFIKKQNQQLFMALPEKYCLAV